MRRVFNYILVFQLLLIFSSLSFAQRPSNIDRTEANDRRSSYIDRMEANDKRTRRMGEFSGIINPRNQIQPVSSGKKKIRIPKQPTQNVLGKLPPSVADLALYQNFLRQPKTGIMRLLSPKSCGEEVFSAYCPEGELPDGGYFYSFREKAYIIKPLADLALIEERLVAGSVLNQGILVKLDNGETDLGNLGLSHEGLKYLVDFAPALTIEEAEQQFERFETGVEVGKYVYKNDLPYQKNATYAVRLTAYHGKAKLRTRGGGEFNILEGDDRRDVIILFRILAVEPDASLTIVWKELQSKESPKLEGN